jgi:hypothetical protein
MRRRLASETLDVEDYGVRTFLPACLLAKACPAITRLARLPQYSLRDRNGRENRQCPNSEILGIIIVFRRSGLQSLCGNLESSASAPKGDLKMQALCHG